MQHELHRLPVTALAFFRKDIILAGEGAYLHAYSKDSRLLRRVHVFEGQAIHGVIVEDTAATTVLVYGGCLLRPLSLQLCGNGELTFILGNVQNVSDWILDAAFAAQSEDLKLHIALVTAHSALWIADIDHSAARVAASPSTVIEKVVAGSNCIVYSAHVKWLSPSHCLVASGTAFGDIIVWSAFLSEEDGTHTATYHTHFSFSAHEGSVFGLQTSPILTLPGSKRQKRVLLSCSDDRNIKLWDISDLTETSSKIFQGQQDTGFGSLSGNDAMSPPCLANVMGHISRIWHVRCVIGEGSSLRRILSFGEDASVITWTVNANSDASGLPYVLLQRNITSAHSGKNIWSVAFDNSNQLATGGADGAIALHGMTSETESSSEIPCTLLDDLGGGDTFRAYCFVHEDFIVSTTDRGRIVLLDIGHSDGNMATTHLSEPLAQLRGYSVATSVADIAFMAGSDGAVFAYIHRTRQLSKIVDGRRKVAGLFACQVSKRCVALLISRVGATSAEVLLLDHGRDADIVQPTQIKNLSLPSNFIVTSFSCQMQGQDEYAVLGSRAGALAMYKCSATTPPKMTIASSVHQMIHGKEAITSIHWITEGCSIDAGWLFSTGRNGTLAVHRVTISGGELELNLVHQLLLPFGPNIEGLALSPQGRLQLWGFKTKLFVAYDVSLQREIMTIECGGAHRSWAFRPSHDGGTFVWTKASKLYRKSQSSLPHELLNSGSHGREIKSVAVTLARDEPQIIATGAEDTDIKLFKLDRGTFRCLQTLRRHNTGIQHLQWSADGGYLFSSGGFEEFFVWKVSHGIPYINIGVFCESLHPRSGTSDLRIMGFNVKEGSRCPESGRIPCFRILMAYSDSTVKLWTYTDGKWSLLAAVDYLTSCLTNVLQRGQDDSSYLTTATDGHIVSWQLDHSQLQLSWTERHKVHQSAIHVTASLEFVDGSILLVTGGDDNAIGITRIAPRGETTTETLLISRAHAAAVTGLVLLTVSEHTYWLASAGIDERVKLWQVTIDPAYPGVSGVSVKLLQNVFTAIADASTLEICKLEDSSLGVLICGVGMELWKLPMVQDTDHNIERTVHR